MAEGLKKATGTRLCISVTGIAGPDGGTEEKPVGSSISVQFWTAGASARNSGSGISAENGTGITPFYACWISLIS
jgi:nicotinamide mononucleotide (NMN) deamidase PncC